MNVKLSVSSYVTISKGVDMHIKKYYNNLLSKHLTLRGFTSIDFNNVSYYNNKNLTIRAVGCPHLHKEGGVVYIFKSSKEDIENYILIKEVKSLDIGKFGCRIDMLLDSRLKYKNILAVSSLSDSEDIMQTYVYSNIFGTNPNLTIINSIVPIERVTSVKLSLSKNTLNKESLLILVKGRNIHNDLISRYWEEYNLNVRKDEIIIDSRNDDER